MKTFIINIEIEHTDRNFSSTPIQQFISEMGSPSSNWVRTMKKAFTETILGENAHNINVTYSIKEGNNHVRIVMANVNNENMWRVYVNQEPIFESINQAHAFAIAEYYKNQ